MKHAKKARHSDNGIQSKPGQQPGKGTVRIGGSRTHSVTLILVALALNGLVNTVWSAPVAAVKGPVVQPIKDGVRLRYVADERAFGEVWVFDKEWKNRKVPDSRKFLMKIPEAKFFPLPSRQPAGKLAPHFRDIPLQKLKPGTQYWYEFSVDVPTFAPFKTNGTFRTPIRID